MDGAASFDTDRPGGKISELPASRSADQRAPRVVRVLAVYILFGIGVLSPLAWISVPALVDYPNHLARMWILVHDADIAELARNYVVEWRVLPDLAMDLVVPILARFVPIELAGRLFIALTIVLLVGGTATLHRVLHGRIGIWPVWSVLFVYNAVLFWGFLNCLFGIAASLFVFAGWIATRHWRAVPRILLFAVPASILLLLHLFAFGLYGLLVATYELGGRGDWRRMRLHGLLELAAPGLQFIPGVLLWHASLAHAGAAPSLYGSLDAKLYAALAPFTFGYVPVAFDGLIAATSCAFLVIGLLSRSLAVSPRMRLPLVALAITAVLMPNVASGGWLADLRLPAAMPFLIIAGTRLNLPSARLATLLAAVALGIFGLRIWSVTEGWRVYDREFAEFRAASAAIAPGSRLLVVSSPVPQRARRLPGVPTELAIRQPVVYTHMAALAVIDRSAFFPYLFAGWTTIDVTAGNRDMFQHVAGPMTPHQIEEAAVPGHLEARYTKPNFYGELPYWRDWPDTFDFALWLDLGKGPAPVVPVPLRLITERDFFRIYRIEPMARSRVRTDASSPSPAQRP